MGCCGEEEEDILQPLQQQQTPTLHSSSSSMASSITGDDSYTTISPMNSNFAALICKDILRTIFEKLPVVDLARSACVCRLWSSVASDRDIQVRAFKAPWKLKGVIGNPSSGSFWRDNRLSRFAISHRLVRSDTVASLAVKYSVQVMDIKRLNNMMSDHGIHSRDRLLIPFCIWKVDDGTAQYYLSLSNGDPRGAVMEFSEDLRWEREARNSKKMVCDFFQVETLGVGLQAADYMYQ
ncbi:unnamed protein product [Lactuca saligna]|uniref:LysM domain-containing protein n=1 Tax=Lactuca saligna TaxID=75948 RepID=A0AA36A4R1_LACSI|nr:unnamed protein product [Lactuca saligna]